VSRSSIRCEVRGRVLIDHLVSTYSGVVCRQLPVTPRSLSQPQRAEVSALIVNGELRSVRRDSILNITRQN